MHRKRRPPDLEMVRSVALCAILLLRPRGILGEARVISRHVEGLQEDERRMGVDDINGAVGRAENT